MREHSGYDAAERLIQQRNWEAHGRERLDLDDAHTMLRIIEAATDARVIDPAEAAPLADKLHTGVGHSSRGSEWTHGDRAYTRRGATDQL